MLIATGCEGGLTGRGAHRLIIDDPIRDRADAESESLRERLWQWYSDVSRTRLMQNDRIVLCQTRWHAATRLTVLREDLHPRRREAKSGNVLLQKPGLGEIAAG